MERKTMYHMRIPMLRNGKDGDQRRESRAKGGLESHRWVRMRGRGAVRQDNQRKRDHNVSSLLYFDMKRWRIGGNKSADGRALKIKGHKVTPAFFSMKSRGTKKRIGGGLEGTTIKRASKNTAFIIEQYIQRITIAIYLPCGAAKKCDPQIRDMIVFSGFFGVS